MENYKNLLMSPNLRLQRKNEKRWLLLRFLRQNIWSTQDIIQEVIGLASRQSAHKTLLRMENDELIRRYKYSAVGGSLTIWGITSHGQAMAFDPKMERPYSATFEPSKISEQNIRHHLDLQRLQLVAELKGWQNWVDGYQLGDIPKDGNRPDAIALSPHGSRVAIECERTIKSLKRYEQILATYLRAIKLQKVDMVIWVTPTADISKRLKAIITGIKSVRVAGQKIAIEPDKHHINLFFTHYSAWPMFDSQSGGHDGDT